MIAIILADHQAEEMYGLDEHLPLSLFRVVDRPILHHIVDSLIDQGVRQFEFVLDRHPEKIESYLGDGARWGCSFHYHLLAGDREAQETVISIASVQNEPVVLARGDRFPQVKIVADSLPKMYVTEAGDWTGWAFLPAGAWQSSADLLRQVSRESFSQTNSFVKSVAARELATGSAAQLIESQEKLLSGRFTATSIPGVEAQPGVWIGRNVSLDSTVKLIAPLYIGANCKIQAKATLGPFAVIGEGCVIDEQSSVENSLVAPGTYIGQGLELKSVIVERDRLVNVKLETTFLSTENFLLSGLAHGKSRRVRHRILSIVSAIALLIFLFPVAALTLVFLFLSGRGEFVRKRAVCLPAGSDSRQWREFQYLQFELHNSQSSGWWVDFVAEVWVGLAAVLKGHVYLVGVQPRARQQIESLTSDWKSIYVGSKGGLISEASVMFGRNPSEDELYTAEAYYTAVESIRHDYRLLRLYLQRVLFHTGREVPESTEQPASVPTLENVPER